jgi:hypothetical protein
LLFFASEGDIGGRRICARAFLKPAIELDSLDGDARKAVGPICPTEDSNRLILLDWGISYKVHTVLTDNRTHFAYPAGDSWSTAGIREMIAEQKPF